MATQMNDTIWILSVEEFPPGEGPLCIPPDAWADYDHSGRMLRLYTSEPEKVKRATEQA